MVNWYSPDVRIQFKCFKTNKVRITSIEQMSSVEQALFLIWGGCKTSNFFVGQTSETSESEHEFRHSYLCMSSWCTPERYGRYGKGQVWRRRRWTEEQGANHSWATGLEAPSLDSLSASSFPAKPACPGMCCCGEGGEDTDTILTK